jgi:hypothetical protein
MIAALKAADHTGRSTTIGHRTDLRQNRIVIVPRTAMTRGVSCAAPLR